MESITNGSGWPNRNIAKGLLVKPLGGALPLLLAKKPLLYPAWSCMLAESNLLLCVAPRPASIWDPFSDRADAGCFAGSRAPSEC